MYILSRLLVILQPHDLQRTYTELGRRACPSSRAVGMQRISILLGHANITSQGLSTENYPEIPHSSAVHRNIELDLEVTISDFVPF